MEQLVARRARCIYVGSSNFAGWHIAKAQRGAPKRGTSSASSREQSLYNLDCPHGRARGAPGLPALRPRRDPVEPARGGLLGGVLAEGRRRAGAGARASLQRTSTSYRPQLERWEKLCARARRGAGRRRAGVAAAQPGGRPRRSSGRARWSSSTGALRALEITARRGRRSTDARRDLPRPGRRRPEAYAW